MSANASTTDRNPPSGTGKPGDHEEPEITQEESVPSDGKDEVGEKMIEALGQDDQAQKTT